MILPWLALAGLVLAGCIGQGGLAGGALPAVIPTLDARPTETQIHEGPGALVGQVVDDEFRPLADAMVEVFRRKADLFLQLQLRTDALGAFAARGLAAGEYVVYVSHARFQPDKPRLVLVEDGKHTRHQWILQPLPPPEPFSKTTSSRLNILAAACVNVVGVPVHVDCDERKPNPSRLHSVQVDELNQTPLHTVIVESRWNPTTSACMGAWRTSIFSPQQDLKEYAQQRTSDNPYHWDNSGQLTSPTRAMADRTEPEESSMNATWRNQPEPFVSHGTWHLFESPAAAAGLGGLDASCMVSQVVQTWLTVFHGRSAPRGWSVFQP